MRENDIHRIQQALIAEHADIWLCYDFQKNNPIFTELYGRQMSTTRRTFLFVYSHKNPVILAARVDETSFNDWLWDKCFYSDRLEMEGKIDACLRGANKVLLEYAPRGSLPYISRVDAGSLELFRDLCSATFETSAGVYQRAIAAWSKEDIVEHEKAVIAIQSALDRALNLISQNCRTQSPPSELQVQELIMQTFHDYDCETDELPIVAVNDHTANPHFENTPSNDRPIGPNSWVLIDLWARSRGDDGVYADVTWMAFTGNNPPSICQSIFEAVRCGRDRGLEHLRNALSSGQNPQGWEIDEAVRNEIKNKGFGLNFTHRTGHSLGRRVLHGPGTHLDNYETRDIRPLTDGSAFTIEPGIYLDQIGCRLEIDVIIRGKNVIVTTPLQNNITML